MAKEAKLDMEILIVDDDSNDGSLELAQSLSKMYPLRFILRKTKKGLSSAVLNGFQEANSDILVVMDADLSHPPTAIPGLIKPIQRLRSSFVLGSRYTKGFWVENWPFSRRIISLGATLLARPITPGKITDPMSGFFAIRRDTLASCDRLNPLGFKIGLELMVKCHLNRDHVSEIPITFKDRERGESKLNFKQQVFYLTHLWRLYFYSYPMFLSLASIAFLCLIVFTISFLINTRAHSREKIIKPI